MLDVSNRSVTMSVKLLTVTVEVSTSNIMLNSPRQNIT